MAKTSALSVINTILLVVLIVIGVIAIFRSTQSDVTPGETTPERDVEQTDSQPLTIEPPKQPISQEQEDLSTTGSLESEHGYAMELIGDYEVSFTLADADQENVPEEVLDFSRIDTEATRAAFEGSLEGWPALVVHVFPNDANLDFEAWATQYVDYTNYDPIYLHKEIEEFQIDGRNGVSFWWSGLGFGENYIIELGDNMLMVTVHAFDESDPIFAHAEQMIQSITFNE